MAEDEQHIRRPQPRRPGTFSMTPLTTDGTSLRPSPRVSPNTPTSSTSDLLPSPSGGIGQKTRSVLNLTSSALFGIYSPEGRENYDPQSLEASRSGLTPYGTGAQTPVRSPSVETLSGGGSKNTSSFFMTASMAELAREAERKSRRSEMEDATGNEKRHGSTTDKSNARPRAMSHDHRMKSMTRDIPGIVLRAVALFVIGVAYGILVTQLQDKQMVVPVKVEGINTDSNWYLPLWGTSGMVLGNALPFFDRLYGTKVAKHKDTTNQQPQREGEKTSQNQAPAGDGRDDNTRTGLGAEWNPIVRSIGAFVGVAFAIRRLPWQSTLQLSLTLALANPCLWWLTDRTRNGFLFSSFVGFVGAAGLLIVWPGMIPTASRFPIVSTTASITGANASSGTVPVSAGLAENLPLGLGNLGFTYEGIGVATWVASVLFCSAVCFGNIGRRLHGSQKR